MCPEWRWLWLTDEDTGVLVSVCYLMHTLTSTHSWHCILSWRHNQFSWSQVAAVIQSVWLMPWHWVILLRLHMVNDAVWLVMKAWTVIFATSSTCDLHTVFICHRWQQLLLDRRSPCGLKVNTQSSYTLWHIGSLSFVKTKVYNLGLKPSLNPNG